MSGARGLSGSRCCDGECLGTISLRCLKLGAQTPVARKAISSACVCFCGTRVRSCLRPRLEDNRGSPYWAYGRVATEIGFTCPSFGVATAISQHQEDVWFYRIDFESGESRYAAHGMDVPLVTQTLDRFGLATFLYDSDRREDAVPLSIKIARMWSSFAHSGNPNSGSMQEWPRFDRQSMRMRVFDLESSNSQFDRLEQCRFWGSHDQAPSW